MSHLYIVRQSPQAVLRAAALFSPNVLAVQISLLLFPACQKEDRPESLYRQHSKQQATVTASGITEVANAIDILDIIIILVADSGRAASFRGGSRS